MTTKDPIGLEKARIIGRMKQADLDNQAYVKSKIKLYGVISSMTTKEVDEKLSVHQSLITSEAPSLSYSTSATATTPIHHMAFFNCPLTLWKNIVHVVTTRTAGNKRIDQDRVTVDYATIRQRATETLADFHHSMSHTVESFEMLGLDKPPSETQAMRFIYKGWTARDTRQCKHPLQINFTKVETCTRQTYPLLN